MIQNYKNFAREMEEKIATDLLNSHFMVLSTNSPSQQSVHTFISLFFYLPIYSFIYSILFFLLLSYLSIISCFLAMSCYFFKVGFISPPKCHTASKLG